MTYMPVSREVLEDAPHFHEWSSLMLVRTLGPKPHRFRKVWNAGYWQALEDVRSGRVVLQDGHFRAGLAALLEPK